MSEASAVSGGPSVAPAEPASAPAAGLLSRTGLVRSFLQANEFATGGFALMLTTAALATAGRACQLGIEHAKRRMLTRADIDSRDEAYTWFMQWLANHPSQQHSRKVTISSSLKGKKAFSRHDNKEKKGSKQVLYIPGTGEHRIWFQGHWVWIHRDKNPTQSFDPYGFAGAMPDKETLHITILGDRAVLEALVAEVKEFYAAAMNKRAVIYSTCQDGFWERVGSRAIRPLNTVVLPENQAKAVLDDCREFLACEQWYSNNGIPYRRGYLLYGPPGTGKTSLVTALAGELQLDVYVVTLSSPSMTDEMLRSLLNSASARSILLLEDVDAAFVGRVATTEGQAAARLTFSGLLNAIDGVAAQEGRLLFMTTNHIDRLSSALIRPGRVDVRVQFVLATAPQIRALFVSFYSSLPAFRLATAPAAGVLPVEGPTVATGTELPAAADAVGNAAAAAPASGGSDGSDAAGAGSGSTGKAAISIHADSTAAPAAQPEGAGSTAAGGDGSTEGSTELAPGSQGAGSDGTHHGSKSAGGRGSEAGIGGGKLVELSDRFAAAVPEGVVSMAQLQGYLVAHKFDPEGAVRDVGQLLESCRAAAEEAAKDAAKEAAKDAGKEAAAAGAREQANGVGKEGAKVAAGEAASDTVNAKDVE